MRVLGSLLLLSALGTGASRAVATTPTAIPVIGRAVVPNAYEPARPCTLLLLPPGDRLRGPGLTVTGPTPALPDSQGEFSAMPFGRDDVTFDQVNVFWHAQRHLLRLRSYGLDLEEIPVTARVQQGIGSGTLFTEPVATIGTGEGGLFADTKDGDIIVHEITHAVFNPRMGTAVHPLAKGEAGAVAEGIADYFAAVANGNTRIGEFSCPPNGYYDVATDPSVYNYSRWDMLPGDNYSRGKILNGALFGLHARVGDVADMLAIQALAYRPSRCMPCFADAMRWADLDLHGGAHLAALDAAFGERGIGSLPPAIFSFVGPLLGLRGDRASYRLTLGAGIGPYRVRWEQSFDSGGRWDALPAETDSVEIAFSTSFLLRVAVRDRLDRSSDSLTLNVRVLDPDQLRLGRLRLSGPAYLEPRQQVRVRLAIEGSRGVPPLRVAWSLSGGALAVSPPSDSGVTIAAPQRGTAIVAASCTDSLGSVSRDTLRILVVLPLRGGMQGPVDVAPGQSAMFRASPSDVLPPYRHEWRQRLADGTEDSLATGDSATSQRTIQSFEIVLATTDARGALVETRRAVTVRPTVGAADATPRRFRLLGPTVRAGGPLTFELPDGPLPGSLEILDVTGRVRARIGPLSPTARVVTIAPPSAPGLYFARWTTAQGRPTLRFIVLH